jgi:hypothetical protein
VFWLALLVAGVVPCTTLAAAKGAKPRTRQLAAQVSTLDDRINAKFTVYVRAVDALNAVRGEIAQNRERVKLAEYSLSVAKRELRASVVASYKHQSVSFLDVLFTSANLGDLLGGLGLVKWLGVHDATVIAHVRALKKQIADRQVILQADAVAAGKLVAVLDGQIKVVRRELAGRRRLLAGARAQIARPTVQQAAGAASSGSPGVMLPGHGPWWPLIKAAAGKYGVSAGGMYRLMMVESGGNASSGAGGPYVGLFQYSASAWRGSWNPWARASIHDGRAQIRATALAIHLGHGPGWWPGTYSWAFGK